MYSQTLSLFWDPLYSTGLLYVYSMYTEDNVSETVISFLLYSAPWKLFPPFYTPAHLSILLSQLFWCWFLLVYFSCRLLCCSSLLICSLLLVKYFLYLLDPCLHLFPRFWINHFTVITLNYFSDRLPISSSFICAWLGTCRGFYYGSDWCLQFGG